MSDKTCGECCHLERTENFSFRCKHCNGAVSSSNTACNHFSKQYGICPECGSYLFSYEHTGDNDWQLCTCERCGCSGTPEEFLYNSVFARIASSPEVLAPKFVYNKFYIEYRGDSSCWISSYFSTIIPGKSWEYETEAIAATVAKLKDVEW